LPLLRVPEHQQQPAALAGERQQPQEGAWVTVTPAAAAAAAIVVLPAYPTSLQYCTGHARTSTTLSPPMPLAWRACSQGSLHNTFTYTLTCTCLVMQAVQQVVGAAASALNLTPLSSAQPLTVQALQQVEKFKGKQPAFVFAFVDPGCLV
jgi:hypothetical protein